MLYASAAVMGAVTVVTWRTPSMENIVGLSKIRNDDIAPDDDASGIEHGAVDTFFVSLTGVETPTWFEHRDKKRWLYVHNSPLVVVVPCWLCLVTRRRRCMVD